MKQQKILTIILCLLSCLLIVAPASATTQSQFLLNSTGGIAPQSVLFTDKSLGSPSSWNWYETIYHNGVYSSGPTSFSTSQTPTQSFGIAGSDYEYFINETTTNAGGSNISVQNTWVNTTNIVASYWPLMLA